MPLPALYESLDAVARQLPFHLNETDRVNQAFQRWRQQKDPRAGYIVDLWTYCFIRRYFLVKFAQDALFGSASDLEMLVERVYARVQDRRGTVADSTRYAGWVSVVCKHTFLNYLRSRNSLVSLNQENGPQLRADSLEAALDAGMAFEGLRQAIERLPAFLQDVARLRFLEGCSYREIEEKTGKDLPTIRSYANKAVVRFRADARLLDHLGRSPG